VAHNKLRVLLTAFIFMMIAAGCVPMATDGSTAPLYATGETCRLADVGALIPCPGHNPATGYCVLQFCDPWNGGMATSCTGVPCSSVPPPYVDYTADGGTGCTPYADRPCTASGSLFGHQLCDVGGNWMMCQPFGSAVDAGTSPVTDAGTGCDSDPLIETACTVGIGECAADGVWSCVGGVRECALNPGEVIGTPASELCDNLDNDCDGAVDEGIMDHQYSGPAGTRDVGICHADTRVCAAGVWLVTVAEQTPLAEVPDNDVDENCNGGLLFSVSCGGDPRIDTGCMAGVGTCLDTGTWSCVGNELVCDATPGTPVPEICDNLDNDCDGQTDEELFQSFYSGPAGTAGIGICRYGLDRCVAGVWTLDSPEVLPLTEICGDGIDQNCNGHDDACPACGGDPMITDPPTTCTVGTGECAADGVWACDTGNVHCTASPGAAVDEICDNLDNDCDGAVDEGMAQTCYIVGRDQSEAGVGICALGMRLCTAGIWGSCMGAVGPAAEICDDGLDQDCNGSDLHCGTACGSDPRITDPPTACTTGTGACQASGVYECTAGTVTCSATPGAPSVETCNGLDDNCNYVVDEAPGGGALTQSCFPFTTGLPGIGVCVAGVQTCASGTFGTCSGAIGPSAEICGDDLDNDCDTGTDEIGDCPVPVTDAGMPMVDAGSPTMDAGTPVADAGTAGADAGMTSVDAGLPSDIPTSGYASWVDPSIPETTWCPSGGTLEVRVWDNIDNDIPDVNEMHVGTSPFVVSIDSNGVALTGSYTNDTLYCRTGSGLYMGYYSPRLRDATNGVTCASIGVRKYLNGGEIPCFICWDQQWAGSMDARSTDYRRTQARLTPDVAANTACMSGTLLP
jgi:hypothetical protein